MTNSKPSSQDLWNGWHRGRLLFHAPEFFIPPDYLTRYRAESDSETDAHFQNTTPEKSDGFAVTIHGLLNSHRTFFADSNFTKKVQSVILEGLRRRNLIGLGFVVPRKPDDAPAQVPNDLWNGKVNWHKCTVEAHGLRFESVRIITSNILSPEENEVIAAQGRPSRSDFIVRAFDELWQMGKITLRRPMRQNYPIIRKYVMERYPNKENDDSGLSDNVMQDLVNPLIKKELLQNRKP